MAECFVRLSNSRNPSLAALLSIVPGMGQLYNGELLKGILFLLVALCNYIFIALQVPNCLSALLYDVARTSCIEFNYDLVWRLADLRAGDAWSGAGLLFLLGFSIYVVMDAYITAKHILGKNSRTSTDRNNFVELVCTSFLYHTILFSALMTITLLFSMPLRLPVRWIDLEFIDPIPLTAVVGKPAAQLSDSEFKKMVLSNRLREYVQSIKSAMFAHALHCPNEQLVVIVGFKVSKDGCVKDHHIAKSSGDTELDKSLLEESQKLRVWSRPPSAVSKDINCYIAFPELEMSNPNAIMKMGPEEIWI